MRELLSLDLNLLLALDALLELRSVTGAARRLGMSQPTMSQALARLREALGDPLLVRQGNVMVPTPRALALALPLRAALRELAAALRQGEGFDAAASQRVFTLAIHDLNAALLLPGLLPGLRADAPGVTLSLAPFEPGRVVEQLREGAVDLAVSVLREVPPDLEVRALGEDRLVGLVRRGHPLLDAQVTPERLAGWPHALISITGRGGGRVDEALEARGLSRALRLRLPYFLLAPQVLLGSDLVLAVPGRLASLFSASHALSPFALPFEPITFTLSMAWSGHLDADEGHRWLRDRVLGALTAPAATPTMQGAPPEG